MKKLILALLLVLLSVSLAWAQPGPRPGLLVDETDGNPSTTYVYKLRFAPGVLTVSDAIGTVTSGTPGADSIDDTMIDWGIDAGQVGIDDFNLNYGQVIVGDSGHKAAATSILPNIAIGCSTTTLSADNTMSCNKLVAEINAGETIAQYNLVYMKSDGKFWKANGDQTAGPLGPAVGITTAACTADAECIVCESGCIRDDAWSALTIGGNVYLDDTAGALTQTANASSGDAHQVIGYAVSAVIINFNFAHPYLLVE